MMRIGIIGCGKIIKRHIKHLEERPQAVIAALCDVDIEAAHAVRDTYLGSGVPCYSDMSQMLGDERLDAVIIATPHTMHYDHAVGAIEAGCHVFLEKPMVTSTQQAYELRDLAAQHGKKVAVGFNTSSKKVFRFLRRQIRSGAYGSLQMVNGFLCQNWLEGTSGTWRQDPSLSGGGQAYDSGAHIINSLLWSTESPPQIVYALVDHRGRAVDINSIVSIRFENGVLANLTISGDCVAAGQHMVFIFSDARVEIDGWAGEWIKVYRQDGEEEIDGDLPEIFPINNFVDAVQDGAEIFAGIPHGINHSLLMDGIYQSAKRGQPVSVDGHGGSV